MRGDRRWPFRIVVAALLVATGWWLFDEETHEPRPLPDDEAEERADYFMEGFTVRATDATGRPAYQLQAPRMDYFLGPDEWIVEAPRIRHAAETGEPWYLAAERGTGHDRLERIRLHGDVTVRRAGGPDNVATRVDTRNVTLRPDQRHVETDEHALFRQPGVRMEGTGVRADLARDHLELLDAVRARHADPAR